MAKFFIRLGEFNKAMLLPFLLALAQLIRIILDDVLKEKNFEQLKRQKIGLLTHAPATDSDNVPTYEVFLNSGNN